MSRLLSVPGHEVIAAHARNVRLIGERRKKEDRLDAQTFCRILGARERNEAELVLHRVNRLFTEGDQRFVIHQGDAQSSAFDTCLREAVLGRAVGFPLTPARALPMLEVLDAEALTRFQRRRCVSLLDSPGRRTTLWLRVIDPALARCLVRMYRGLAGKVIG